MMKHFILEELVDEHTFKAHGENCWKIFNPELLKMMDDIRSYFGLPITINNWHRGGKFQYRGYRPVTCEVGASYSPHKIGWAFDFDVQGIPAEYVRQEILANQDHALLSRIQRMEAAVNWVHADIVNSNKNRIYLFKA